MSSLKITVITAVVVFGVGLGLGGCVNSSSPKNSATTTPATGGVAPAADQKLGTTTKSGQIVQLGGGYYLQTPGQSPELIESYNLDLSQYVGQSVTVSGQFSGDTLFVNQVE